MMSMITLGNFDSNSKGDRMTNEHLQTFLPFYGSNTKRTERQNGRKIKDP